MKFNVGDRARLVYVRNPKYQELVGSEVTIIRIKDGISLDGYRYDCGIEVSEAFGGFRVGAIFDQLEPIIELGSWDDLEREIGWNPTKETAEVCDASSY